MQIYVVRPGDTLWGIAQRYSISPDLLAAANEIPNPDRLVIGQAIVIPTVTQEPRPMIETGAYLDVADTGAASPAVVDRVGIHLTYLTIFSYAVNRDGSLTP